MTDQSVADDLLAGFHKRWEACEARKRDVQDDLKALSAEIKAAGFDASVARAAFRQVSMADDAKTQERDALIDLYVSSLTRDARTHVRAA